MTGFIMPLFVVRCLVNITIQDTRVFSRHKPMPGRQKANLYRDLRLCYFQLRLGVFSRHHRQMSLSSLWGPFCSRTHQASAAEEVYQGLLTLFPRLNYRFHYLFHHAGRRNFYFPTFLVEWEAVASHSMLARQSPRRR